MNLIVNLFRPLIIIFICGSFSCCKEKSVNKTVIEGVIEVDDRDKIKLSFNDLFSHVSLIPLETRQETAIKQIDKLILHNDKFYILDKGQSAVLVFSSIGKYLFKIQSVGRGPGEYSLLYDININEFRNTLDLLNPRGKLLSYDFEGNFVDELMLPMKASHFFHHLNPDTIIFNTKYEPKKLAYFSKHANCLVNTSFSFPEFIYQTPLIQLSSPFVKYGKEFLFFQGYSNTIYTLKGTEMKERFTWNFGDHNINLEEFPDNESIQFYINYLKKSDFVWGFTHYAENDDIILTRFVYDETLYNLIYYKQQKKYIIVRKITEDVYFPIVYILTNDKLITTIEPSKIQLILKPGMLDEHEAQIYKSIDPEDNPVIVIYTLK
jgi:hypothetical protein